MEDGQLAKSGEEDPPAIPTQTLLSLSRPPETDNIRNFIRNFRWHPFHQHDRRG